MGFSVLWASTKMVGYWFQKMALKESWSWNDKTKPDKHFSNGEDIWAIKICFFTDSETKLSFSWPHRHVIMSSPISIHCFTLSKPCVCSFSSLRSCSKPTKFHLSRWPLRLGFSPFSPWTGLKHLGISFSPPKTLKLGTLSHFPSGFVFCYLRMCFFALIYTYIYVYFWVQGRIECLKEEAFMLRCLVLELLRLWLLGL